MKIVRSGLPVAAVLLALFAAGCGSTNAAGAAASPSGTPLADIDVAIITAITADSVTWVDGEIVPSTMDNQTVKRRPGAEHTHTARLASNATFFVALDSSGAPAVDSNGLGTASVGRAQFAEQVVNQDLNAPKIFFDAQGRIVKMAARYHP